MHLLFKLTLNSHAAMAPDRGSLVPSRRCYVSGREGSCLKSCFFRLGILFGLKGNHKKSPRKLTLNSPNRGLFHQRANIGNPIRSFGPRHSGALAGSRICGLVDHGSYQEHQKWSGLPVAEASHPLQGAPKEKTHPHLDVLSAWPTSSSKQ